jgi:hypothetical protein
LGVALPLYLNAVSQFASTVGKEEKSSTATSKKKQHQQLTPHAHSNYDLIAFLGCKTTVTVTSHIK